MNSPATPAHKSAIHRSTVKRKGKGGGSGCGAEQARDSNKMKKIIFAIATGAAIIATPAAALAQAPGGGTRIQRDQTRQEAQQRADMIFQLLDANRDGVVTRAEAEQAAAQFRAARAGGEGGRGGMMQRIIGQVFATSPSISLQQFEGMMLGRFDAQDANHDGVLSVAERQQARAQARPDQAGGQAPIVPAPGAAPQPPRQ